MTVGSLGQVKLIMILGRWDMKNLGPAGCRACQNHSEMRNRLGNIMLVREQTGTERTRQSLSHQLTQLGGLTALGTTSQIVNSTT